MRGVSDSKKEQCQKIGKNLLYVCRINIDKMSKMVNGHIVRKEHTFEEMTHLIS